MLYGYVCRYWNLELDSFFEFKCYVSLYLLRTVSSQNAKKSKGGGSCQKTTFKAHGTPSVWVSKGKPGTVEAGYCICLSVHAPGTRLELQNLYRHIDEKKKKKKKREKERRIASLLRTSSQHILSTDRE
jgi:5-deoxy-D-glucuronate isomerase